MGTFNCVLSGLLAGKLWGASTGRTAFWLRGVLPVYVVEDEFVLSETLFALLMLSAVWLYSITYKHDHKWHVALIGLVIGGCVLTREAAIIYPVIFAVALGFSGFNSADRVQRIAIFGFVFLLVLCPWLIRNHIVWNSALPLSYTAGVNLHIGNHEGARGGYTDPPKLESANARFGTPEYDAAHRNAAIDYMISNPVRVFLLGFKKLANASLPEFHRFDIRTIYGSGFKWAMPVAILSAGSSALLLVCGIWGFIFAKRDEVWWLSLVLSGFTLAVIFISFGAPRFRDPIDNLLVLYSAWLLSNLERIKSVIGFGSGRQSWNTAAAIACMLCLFAGWSTLVI